MTPTPISDFDDVILFELQKKVQIGKLPSLSFGEMWKASADAAPNFYAPIDPTVRRSAFIARMMQAVEILHKSELITVSTNYGDKIDSIMLTEAGINHVSKIVYTNQQRYAKV
ncbi:MAG: hypothetical protein Q8L88_02445 [Bacteroidota bacterium]|nr:hypothetical protein [Bacteroidota bacterium]